MRFMAAVLLVLVTSEIASAQDTLAPKTLAAIKRATAYIQLGQDGRLVASGSGFIVHVEKDRAIVVTNHHVVKSLFEVPKAPNPFGLPPGFGGANPPPGLAPEPKPSKTPIKGAEVHVVLDSGSKDERVFKGEFLGSDSEVDLAVIRIWGKSFPEAIDLANPPELIETMPVYSFGFPLGHILSLDDKNNPAITVGRAVVSSLRSNAAGELTRVQIDGNLNPGNSGGPIVDSKGRLVGVAVSIIKDSNGIGFAVPCAEVTKILAGRPGECAVTQVVKDSTARVSVAFDVLDPFGKVKAAKLYYLPASKWDRRELPKGPLGDVRGAKKIDAPIAKAIATAKLTIDEGKEQEVLVQAEVENSGAMPVLGSVTRLPLEMPRALAEAKPERARPGRERGGIPGNDPRDQLDRMKREMDRAKKEMEERRDRRFGDDGPRIVGSRSRTEFQDDAPVGGLLVGVEIGLKTFIRGELVGAIRPIYRTARGETKGKSYGSGDFSKPFVIKAKAGYAVGGASIRAGLIVNGLCLRYMRVSDGKLDATDAYESQWIGDRTGGREESVGGDGTPAVGIIGRTDQKYVTALGLVQKEGARIDWPNDGTPPADAERESPKKSERKKPRSEPEAMKPKAKPAKEPEAGSSGDSGYTDEAPSGGVLIGFEFGMRDTLSGDMIGALRPIYRTLEGEKMGAPLGEDFSRPVVVKAQNGFAVGGATVRAGTTLHGLTLKFMRMKGAQLDPTDFYLSDFVGLNEGGKVSPMGGDGRPVIGVTGKTKGKFATGLGLKHAR